MIYDRHEFLAKMPYDQDILLIPERQIEPTCKCEYFVPSSPIDRIQMQEFWAWTRAHMEGNVKCFSSNDVTEWWGFTAYEDAFLFCLTWR